MRNRSPLSQLVWRNLDGRGAIDAVPTIADINTIAGDYQRRKNGESSSEEETSRLSTVLTGLEFIQANVYLSSNNLMTPEHLSHFLDWIYQVNGRWILKTLLLPRLPTTEIFAANLLPCAVRANDLEAVRFLLSVGASPNARTHALSVVPVTSDPNMPRIQPFKSALCEAIGNNNITMVRLLLVYGAEINPVLNTYSNPSPLQEAILLASPAEMVKTLLMNGANVDPAIPSETSEKLAPPLTLAVISGNAWTVQTLLKAGANVNKWSPKHGTALQAAVASDNIRILRILVHEGADVNAQTFLSMKSQARRLPLFDLDGPSWMSPFASATQNGNMAIVRILLEAGADINGHVSHANLQYHSDYATYLLDLSAPRETFRRITRTPLQTSLYQGNIELVQFLLVAGAPVNIIHNEDGLLQIAIRHSNMELVELLLSYGAPICTPALWPFEMTPVQAAAENGNPAFLRTLLENTTDIAGYLSINEGPSSYGGRTALQGAAEKGHVEMVELLLALGADVHGPVAERNGITTLQAAVRSRNTDVAHLVLAAGAGTNVPYGTTFALAIAIRNNDLAMFNLLFQYDMDVHSWPAEILSSLLEPAAYPPSTFFLRKLLSLGINVNVRWLQNRKQMTALEIAVSSNHLDAVKLLLQAGADIKACEGHDIGGEALSVAVQKSRIDIAKLLLEAGVDVNPRTGISLQCNHIGAAALAQATFNLDADMVILLLQYGADPSAEAPGYTSPLVNAVLGSVRGERGEHLVRLLLDAGAQINNHVKMPYGLDEVLPGSLLAVAAQSGSVELVGLLLDSGADPNWRYDLDNWTALQCAIASSSDDVVHVILEAGADINASPSTTDGRTALQQAASQGNLGFVRLLLQKGADVNSPAGKVRGVTALQAASIQGHLAVVVQLLHAGADVNGESSESEGRTALQGAAEMGRLDIVSLLLENDRKMEGFYDRCQDAAKYARSGRHSVIERLLLNHRKS
ncbi:MAG: hypothetical protein Q9172_006954 [Xanthocarpia lactea]